MLPMVSPRLDINERASDHTTAVAITSTQVMEPEKQRSSAEFTNDSDVVIYLALGVDAAVNRGIRLNANGGAYEIGSTNLWKGTVNAIHGGAGTKILCAVQVRQGNQ
ncbi:hypothetical protein ES703_76312 [subsurface metagenome]